MLFTQDSSALQTPALYRITNFNPLFDLILLFTLSLIFIFVARHKYQWPQWHYLLETIGKPGPKDEDLSELYEDEYDEYGEDDEK